jgi:hypothetical protein
MLYHLTVIAVLQVLLAFPYPHFHLLIKKTGRCYRPSNPIPYAFIILLFVESLFVCLCCESKLSILPQRDSSSQFFMLFGNHMVPPLLGAESLCLSLLTMSQRPL